MKVKIKQECEYRSKRYHKGDEVEVKPEVEEVLLRFNYAEKSEVPGSDDGPGDEKANKVSATKKEEVKKTTSKKVTTEKAAK